MASDKSKKSLEAADAGGLTHKDVKHLRELVAELTRQNETLAELVKAYAKQNKRHAKEREKAENGDAREKGKGDREASKHAKPGKHEARQTPDGKRGDVDAAPTVAPIHLRGAVKQRKSHR